MQSFLSITCIYLVTGMFTKGRRSNDYWNDMEGFDFYLWGDIHLLLSAFKPDRDCCRSDDRHFFSSQLFLLPFDCSLFSLCTERAYFSFLFFFKAINRGIWYNFWYSFSFLAHIQVRCCLFTDITTHPSCHCNRECSMFKTASFPFLLLFIFRL